MRKRISRFRIYAISFILWFSVVLSIGIVASNDFFRECKEDILNFANEHIPVKLYVDDVKLVFPFTLNFNKITVGTKDAKDEFLYVDNLQFVLNPFKYFVRKDVYDILYYVSSQNVTFYTAYFDIDDIEKYVDKSEPSNKDTVAVINEVFDILENKSISINNVRLKYDKEHKLDNFDFNLETLNAYFTDKRYVLSSTFNLPDYTKLSLSLDSTKSLPIEGKVNQFLNINNASLALKANDRSGPLFDYNLELSLKDYDLGVLVHSKVDTRVNANNLLDNKEHELLRASYNIKEKKADFDLNELTVTPKIFRKSIAIINDIKNTDLDKIIPVSSIDLDSKKFAQALAYIDGFVSAKLNMKGSYDPDKLLYIDMSAQTDLTHLALDFDMELTNNTIISDRFKLDIGEETDIEVKFYVPIKNWYASKFSASVKDLNVSDYQTSFDIALSSVFNRNNSAFSQLNIENIRLNQLYLDGESFDILVNKNAKTASIKNTNADDSIFAVDVYFKNTKNLAVAGRGLLPTKFINKIAGKNIIDPLVEVHATYSVTNINNKEKNIKHDLSLYAERIIGLDRIFEASTTLEDSQLLLNSFVFSPDSSNPIKASGRVFQSDTNNFVGAFKVDTPFGSYDPRAVVYMRGNKIAIDIATSDSTIKGTGSVGYDGAVNFNLATTEKFSINGVDILANIDVLKEAQDENINLDGKLDIYVNKDNINFTLKSDLTLISNNTVMLTNMVYQSMGYQMNGYALATMGDVSSNIKLDLKEIDDGEGSIVANAFVNADNINADIGIQKLLISSIYSSKKFDGYLTGGVTVVGAINNPSVELRDVEIADFDFGPDRYHITVKGSYRDREAKIDDIHVKKLGTINKYFDGMARQQTVRIYDGVISEKYQRLNIDVKDLFTLSRYNAKVKYEMKQDSSGVNVYTLLGTGLKINSRKLPNLAVIANYDGNKIVFKTVGSHGLEGNMMLIGGSCIFNMWYIYDNVRLLNGYGEVRSGNANMYLVSENLGLEIFELFSVIFKRIDTYKGDYTFAVGNKNYTLYTHITGPFSSLSINGRFVGRGKVVSQYFDDTLDDSTVDFNFNGNALKINQLTLLTKKDVRGVQMVGEAAFLNNTLEGMNFYLTTTSDAKRSFFRYRPENFLNANADFGIFTTQGLIKLELNFVGSVANPSIVGDVYAERNDINLKMPIVSSLYTTDIYGTVHRVSYDLTIHAISTVKVRYMLAGIFTLKDNSELVVKNNLVNGVEIEADIDVERGSITYAQNTYEVESANMVFSSGSKIDPVINLTSSTKKSYINNGVSSSVTLYMSVVNTRLSSLVGTSGEALENSPIKFYTSPQLSVYETSLLAGVSSTESRGLDSLVGSTSSIYEYSGDTTSQLQDILNSYGDLLLQQYVLNSVEKFIQKGFPFIDYVSINSSLIYGLFFDDVSIFEDFNLSRAFSGTTINFGSYIGNDLLVKAGLTYDEVAYSNDSLNILNETKYALFPTFGFEIQNIIPDLKLVNLGLEYNITPIGVNSGQEVSLKAWQRFNLSDLFKSKSD